MTSNLKKKKVLEPEKSVRVERYAILGTFQHILHSDNAGIVSVASSLTVFFSPDFFIRR